MLEITQYPDPLSLAAAAAEHIVATGGAAIMQRGRFSMAVSGGSTPKAAYSLLSSEPYAQRLKWNYVHIFWVDERCVPPNHPDSNYRMIREALLDHIPIPGGNIHRMHGEENPVLAASAYEQDLRDFLSHSNPTSYTADIDRSFDLILLGMGEDGHTASLFPSSPALEETRRWVVAVKHNQHPAPKVTRLTLTLPFINACAQATFLVTGSNKARTLKEVLSSHKNNFPRLPAQLVRPNTGKLLWLVDKSVNTEW